jgi:hypothetical protein
MFRWYRMAKRCYVYLADVHWPIDLRQSDSEFTRSRWFTRGWTLQELLAPTVVEFFLVDWLFLGLKQDMAAKLSTVTGINTGALQEFDPESFNIAEKMSWASGRNTTRKEDLAYCLLGLFDVNMPLLYGEGEKAFTRLQEELLKIKNDQSIFVWGLPPDTTTLKMFTPGQGYNCNINTQRVRNGQIVDDTTKLFGLLAQSPADFLNSGSVVCHESYNTDGESPPIMFDGGVRIRLPLWSDLDIGSGEPLATQAIRTLKLYTVDLGCSVSNRRLGMSICAWNSTSFGRVKEPVWCSQLDVGTAWELRLASLHLKREKNWKRLSDPCYEILIDFLRWSYFLDEVFTSPLVSYDSATKCLRCFDGFGLLSKSRIMAAFVFRVVSEPSFAFAVLFGFYSKETSPIPADRLWASVIPLEMKFSFESFERGAAKELLAAMRRGEWDLAQRGREFAVPHPHGKHSSSRYILVKVSDGEEVPTRDIESLINVRAVVG